ncbi:MAG TPA: FAD-dependent monooxygenase [Methylomirabilota bacterium]|nr:FAD-dependent monooxygenase [Methylomirabilota bacterium]
MEEKPITIVGGGLAGLTLGIGLRRRSVPVIIWEAGQYPRHRVCGEFVNGRGTEALGRLGLAESLAQAGARTGTTAAFFCGRVGSPVRTLPEPALCLARYKLDALLARHFQDEGGVLRAGQRWQGDRNCEGCVSASGRRLGRGGGARWFGLKVHARDVEMAADLEMHATAGGYVGVCRLGEGLVNICGLFKQTRGAGGSSPWEERLRGQPGTVLNERMGAARFDETSFCSVAGISLRAERAGSRQECCVGDALTMIPPVTGNGMSMAFEAAEVAVDPLAAYSRGGISWQRARESIAGRCDQLFRGRLEWARWLQRMMLAGPALSAAPLALILRWEGLWRKMFERTR